MTYKVVRKDGVFGLDIPGLPTNMGVDVSSGVRRVPAAQMSMAVQALNLFTFDSGQDYVQRAIADGTSLIIEDMTYVLFSMPNDWTSYVKSNGYAIMIPYPIPTSSPLATGQKMPVIMARNKEDVAMYAGLNSNTDMDGDWIIVDGQEDLIAAAGAYAKGSGGMVTPPPSRPPSTTGGCPTGYIFNTDTYQCDPPEQQAIPVKATVITEIATKTPPWVWPVVIGGVALVLVGAAVVSGKQARPVYEMNRRNR